MANLPELKFGVTFTRCSECGKVEVVYCEDCKHWKHPWLEGQTKGKCMIGKTMITDPEHFCSYGERKET